MYLVIEYMNNNGINNEVLFEIGTDKNEELIRPLKIYMNKIYNRIKKVDLENNTKK